MSATAYAGAPVKFTKFIRWWGCLLSCCFVLAAHAEEGVALGIIVDTSGSMAGTVPDGSGGKSPKSAIANRALLAIVDKIEAYSTNAPGGTPPKIQAGLYTFSAGRAQTTLRFGDFDPAALRRWANTPRPPGRGTPLGETLKLAGGDTLKSPLARKHLLVITDGINTSGPDPMSVLPDLRRDAERRNLDLSVHFVAFDIAAKVFTPLKKFGATVFEAANEKELRAQLEFILEEQILLEKEDRK